MKAAAFLDGLDDAAATAALTRCCGATGWVQGMLARRPFGAEERLFVVADEVWATMAQADHLEAFTHHPEIGASLDALRERFAPTAGWSSGEQATVAAATEQTLLALRDGNATYRQRFGFIFIVCATGKSAEQMLGLLRARVDNPREVELANAAREQGEITKIRLAKLVDVLA